MGTQYTNGVWILKNPVAKYAGYNNLWFCIIESEDRHIIQKIYGKSKEEAEANAKLIAAAPELLQALKAAKAVFDSQGINETHSIVGEQYKKVVEAIKSAE